MFAVIGVNGRKAMDVAWVTRDKSGELVVDRGDFFARDAPFSVGNQRRRRIDHARGQIAGENIVEQGRLVGQFQVQGRPTPALIGWRAARSGKFEAGWDVMIVKVDNG